MPNYFNPMQLRKGKSDQFSCRRRCEHKIGRSEHLVSVGQDVLLAYFLTPPSYLLGLFYMGKLDWYLYHTLSYHLHCHTNYSRQCNPLQLQKRMSASKPNETSKITV